MRSAGHIRAETQRASARAHLDRGQAGSETHFPPAPAASPARRHAIIDIQLPHAAGTSYLGRGQVQGEAHHAHAPVASPARRQNERETQLTPAAGTMRSAGHLGFGAQEGDARAHLDRGHPSYEAQRELAPVASPARRHPLDEAQRPLAAGTSYTPANSSALVPDPPRRGIPAVRPYGGRNPLRARRAA